MIEDSVSPDRVWGSAITILSSGRFSALELRGALRGPHYNVAESFNDYAETLVDRDCILAQPPGLHPWNLTPMTIGLFAGANASQMSTGVLHSEQTKADRS